MDVYDMVTKFIFLWNPQPLLHWLLSYDFSQVREVQPMILSIVLSNSNTWPHTTTIIDLAATDVICFIVYLVALVDD